jgi:hypothetical protein
MTKKLPPSNEGTVIFHTGILVPGTYKIAVFLERHNDQVGLAHRWHVAWDSG